MLKQRLNPFQIQLKSNVWRYYAFTFLESLTFFSAVLVPFFTQWGKITLLQVQTLQSWFMFWFFVLEIPTGAVADLLGRKHSLLIGTLVLVFATLIYGSVPKYWVFLLAEFILALGGSLISGANEALLYDSLKEEGKEEQSKKIFGKAKSLHLAGILVGAPIGSLIAAKFGLNFPMQFSALSFVLATLVAATIKEPKRSDKEESESKRYLNIVKQGLSFFVKHHELRSLAVNSILVSVAAYFIIWLYQPLLEKAGVSVKYFGFIHSLLVIAQILVSANFEKLERWFGSSNAYTRYSAVLTAIPFLVVAILPGKVTVLMFVLLAGGFGLSRETFISSQMNKLIPSRQRATVLSSISMFRKFALAAFNPLAGFVADKSISWALFGLGLLPLSIFVIELVKTKAKLDKIKAHVLKKLINSFLFLLLEKTSG